MSGYVGDLSIKQENALQQFREQAGHLLGKDDSDYACLRWLRARNFDVQQAKNMLQKHMTVRKQQNIDNMLKDYQPRPFIKKNLIGGWCGFDKNGGPIWLYPFAGLNVKALLRGASSAEILKQMTYRCELSVKLMEEQSMKLGRNIETHTCIFDFGGFSIIQAFQPDVLSLLSGFISLYEANYPERMQEAVVINAPTLFTVLFNLLKPLLNGRTLQKVSIFGKDNWREFLLERIDKDQLPVHWGGTKTDENGDPMCSSLINVVTPILEEEYKGIRMSKADEVTWVTVERRAVHEVPVEVANTGDTLCWEFETEQHDIAFSIVRRSALDDQEEEEEEVHPWERLDAHIRMQEGSIICDKPGTYVLKFDNMYSSYRSKKLGYVIHVVPTASDDKNDVSTDL
ncbi:SEC14-like protein 2 [Ornithodoros turicata]|uniref:SEC14-like protein 2 n=1 Tax=Ornithodoros turicata TaxID=34597 RepID=UPI003138EB62